MRTIPFFLLLTALAGAAGASGAAPLRALTAALPPLAIDQAPQHPGALVELARELGRRAGVPLQVDFVPWSRALFMATHFPRTAIFPLTRTPEREHQFRWLVPLYHERFVFMAESPAGGRLDPATLRGKRVALLRGSAQEPALRRKGFTHVLPTASVEEGLRFVHAGIADVIYGDLDINMALARARYGAVRYAVSAPVVTTTTWLGGTPDIPAADGTALRAALATMHADGSYARILAGYGLTP
jgi:ABC-type amino acid transport substrate-binding protein